MLVLDRMDSIKAPFLFAGDTSSHARPSGSVSSCPPRLCRERVVGAFDSPDFVVRHDL